MARPDGARNDRRSVQEGLANDLIVCVQDPWDFLATDDVRQSNRSTHEHRGFHGPLPRALKRSLASSSPLRLSSDARALAHPPLKASVAHAATDFPLH
jgi:hypothetical protein